jgi:hypothetical protein
MTGSVAVALWRVQIRRRSLAETQREEETAERRSVE